MKRFSLFQIGAQIGAVGMLALTVLNPVLKADDYNRKTRISISQPLEVPGVVLPPGSYVMKLFNSSSNRHIVQFMNGDENQQLALTFAVSAERIRPTDKTVLTQYEGSRGAPPALRTWFYPGDTVGQEFLYPHGQATRISERTKTSVPEIEAGAETADNPPEETRSEVLIARAAPAPEPLLAPEPQQPVAEPQQTAPPAANQETPAAVSDSLPQTAGEGPLAALIGGLSLIFAFGIRKLKRSRAL